MALFAYAKFIEQSRNGRVEVAIILLNEA